MLGTIGAIAPLLGLLGTVLGIISSFLAITDGAMQDPTMLAAGVSQALITTAAGMIVAIPALVAYRYFQRRIIDINAQFETQAGLMIQELYDYHLLENTSAAGLNVPAHRAPSADVVDHEYAVDGLSFQIMVLPSLFGHLFLSICDCSARYNNPSSTWVFSKLKRVICALENRLLSRSKLTWPRWLIVCCFDCFCCYSSVV